MRCRVDLAPAAQRELSRLPALARFRLAAPILELARSPRLPGARKVRGHPGAWRIRVGPYRVVYDIHDDMALIVILKLARRSESTYSSL